MKKIFIRKIPFAIAIAAVAITAFSGITMLLWNGVLVSVFHIGAITFWQAAGLLILARLLFGGFRGRGGWRGGHWRRRAMYMRWQNMTPEEREKFKGTFYGCGRFRPATAEA